MSANGGVAPKQAAWARNAIRVQPVCDGPGERPSENSRKTRRTTLASSSQIERSPVIGSPSGPVGESRRIHSCCRRQKSSLNATAQPAPGFRREILEEKLIHRALQPDVEFADFAFGQGYDLYALGRPDAERATVYSAGKAPARAKRDAGRSCASHLAAVRIRQGADSSLHCLRRTRKTHPSPGRCRFRSRWISRDSSPGPDRRGGSRWLAHLRVRGHCVSLGLAARLAKDPVRQQQKLL